MVLPQPLQVDVAAVVPQGLGLPLFLQMKQSANRVAMHVYDFHTDLHSAVFANGPIIIGRPMPCPLRLRHAPDIVTAQSETELQL